MKVKEESEKFQKPLFTPFLRKVEEESEKFGLKLNIQKTKNMASGTISSLQIDGETEDEMVGWHHLLNRHEYE